MTQWNPNAPEIIGLEWAASKQGTDLLTSLGVAFAQRTRSLGVEAVTAFEVWANGLGNPRLYLEVYEAGDEVCDAPVSEVFRPTGDDTVTAVQNQAAAIVNLYQSVDETVFDGSDYITETGAASAGIYSATYSGLAAWPTSRRVLDVSITYAVNATTSTAQQVAAHVLDGTGNDLIIRQDSYSVGQGVVTFTAALGPDNPFTALPWSQADIVALSSNAANLELALVFEDYGGGAPNFRMYQQFVTVTYCTENRLAVASCAVPTGGTAAARTMSNVRVPDTGVAGWAKATAKTYSYALRLGAAAQTTGNLVRLSGIVGLPWLDSGTVAPLQTVGTAESYQFTLGAGARVTAIGNATTRLRGIAPLVGAAYSESTQPFDVLTTRELKSFITAGPTLNAQRAVQAVLVTANRTFSRVRMLLRPINLDADDLYLYCYTTADFSGTQKFVEVVTAAEVLALPNVGTLAEPWYLLDRVLTVPTALLAGTTYYVIAGADAGNNVWGTWYALLADTWTAGVGSYRGTTETAFDFAGVADVSADYFATLATIPDPPVPTASSVPVELPGDGTDCSLDAYEGVEVSWVVSPDALVTVTEVQRYDSLTGSWDTVAYVEQDTPTLEWTDLEPAQNIANDYRVRFVRDTGEASEWSATVTATPIAGWCGLVFVSNHDPSQGVGYTWPTPNEWEFPDADQLVTFPLYGRDGVAAFLPTETLGDRFTANVIVNAVTTPATPGRAVFDLLVDLSRDSALPYVAVLDENGRRWYAVLAVPSGNRREPGALYVAPVQVTTVSLTPAPVTV